MNFLKWLDRNFELIIMGAAIVTITVIVFADVVGRRFLVPGSPVHKSFPELVKLLLRQWESLMEYRLTSISGWI